MSTSAEEKQRWMAGIIRRFEGRLIRYANRFLSDLEISREIVQETFVRLWQADHKKVEPILAPWLYTVCRNCALDHRKKEKPMSNSLSADEAQVPASDPSAADRMEQKQSQCLAMRKISKLPEKQREVVLLKFQDGMSYKEISEITGHSVSYVGVLIHTAITELRSTLSEISQTSKGGA